MIIAGSGKIDEESESHIQGQGQDPDLEIQSTDMIMKIKKDVIWANLVRKKDRAGEALCHCHPPCWTADKLLRVGLGPSFIISHVKSRKRSHGRLYSSQDPGDFLPTSSKISSQSASRSMQNFGGPFNVRNVLTTCIICLTCHEMLIQWSFGKL